MASGEAAKARVPTPDRPLPWEGTRRPSVRHTRTATLPRVARREGVVVTGSGHPSATPQGRPRWFARTRRVGRTAEAGTMRCRPYPIAVVVDGGRGNRGRGVGEVIEGGRHRHALTPYQSHGAW